MYDCQSRNTLEHLLALGVESVGQGNGQPDCNFWLTAHTETTWGYKRYRIRPRYIFCDGPRYNRGTGTCFPWGCTQTVSPRARTRRRTNCDERPSALHADYFEHMPPVAVRMPNGALTSLAGNVDRHHRVAVAT